jgi:transcription-repair coupling factor (superfamily II helicase)
MAAEATRVRELADLLDLCRSAPWYEKVVPGLHAGQTASIDGAWGSSSALIAAALSQGCPGTLLIVLPRISELDDYALDLTPYLEETPFVFPAWETLPQEHKASDAIFGARLRVLEALEAATPPSVVVTTLPALLQPVPERASRQAATREIRVRESFPLDELLEWLVARGFERVSAIEQAGEFSVRGGILDVFPPDAVDPFRIEFFGDEVESIRLFDLETQRRVEDVESFRLLAVAPAGTSVAGDEAPSEEPRQSHTFADLGDSCLIDSLPKESWVILSELSDLVSEGRLYRERLVNPRGLFSTESVLARCQQFATITLAAISDAADELSVHLQTESIERFTGKRSEVLEELAEAVEQDEHVLIACHNAGERERLQELLSEKTPQLASRVSLCLGAVHRGFRLVREKIVVISDDELFQRQDVRRAQSQRVRGTKRRLESRSIDSFLDLKRGDLIVHLSHGIGRFRGMKLLEKEGFSEEHLTLEFADQVRIYVPVSLIHLVQKYVGSAGTSPKLSKLGGTGWEKRKQRVAKAVTDMAADMLRLQAAREYSEGIVYPPDSHWMQEFEASFPYIETPDQTLAISESKQDMERSRPMDRLICGDVGFGKTEVAMRAAFKAVDAGKQVAVLVPTTVLAEQHYRSFSDRMAEFPVTIEVLSRFRTRQQQHEILERMKAGKVDIVIGTHRLVQKDVKFEDLGLLIIDEEQRFGVDAKEMLKRMRLSVDVLTLTATPIPRTLHLSLLGIRDISNLTTAPRDRVAIETRTCRWDGELIRRAIVRELNRGGQVYFVHNRVYNIEEIAERIQQIVPEASLAIAHGQMAERELERSMLQFVSGKADILLATTIIESGLDIPNANTIFIHEAQRYGLADLHQLRGRVGRYKHRAYCYLVLDPKVSLSGIAGKRLKAIEEYSELGAGFKIAMRDLEIRGAGNILGTEQSGHIATVGYELYCQLLEDAARKLQDLPAREWRHVHVDLPITAFIPDEYVPNGRQKIDVYRRLSAAGTLEEWQDTADELRDRFGSPPEEVRNLLSVKELQILAWAHGVRGVRLEDRFAVFDYQHRRLMDALKERLGDDFRIVDRKSAYLLLPYKMPREGPALVEFLKSALRGSEG